LKDFEAEYEQLLVELSDLGRQEEAALVRIKERRAQIKRRLPEVNRCIAIWGGDDGPNGRRIPRTSGDFECVVAGCNRMFRTVQGSQRHAQHSRSTGHNFTFLMVDYKALLAEKRQAEKKGTK
jgi:hypothetical protein